ncbi:MAG: tyrosine-type recombinase/integrase [Candidatus Kuenenia sp.]|nr:tyrosine-type recombinase/integrase [Candidatus Kuenenia sp.]
MKQKRVSEFLTEDEIGAVLRVPDRRTLKGKRDYALLLLMFSTGLRKAEVCSLKVSHVSTYRNQPVIDVIGKGNRHRRVALNKDVVEGGIGLSEGVEAKIHRGGRREQQSSP